MKTLIRLCAVLFLLASCGVVTPVKDTTVHHMLDAGIADRRINGASPAIAIARPSVPAYLDRQQLVSRSGGGQLQMNPNHVWAEPLDSAISRVMAINLGRLTGSLNVQPVGNFVTMDYQSLLEIRVQRFEPDSTNQLAFECTWKLQPVAGHLADVHSFRTSVAISPADPSGQIAAMNEALVRLSKEIARSL